MPQEFKNPFVGRRVRSQRVEPGIVEELAVSSAMAVELVRVADAWQLRLMALLVLFGLRPGELSWLFHEDLAEGWLNVRCIPELDYYTKGRREKKFPIDGQLAKFLTDDRVGGTGLLLRRRASDATVISPVPKAELVQDFQRRCVGERRLGAERRRGLRDDVLRGAGQIQYDDVEGEFRKLAAQLNWPRTTTLKDLRHRFSTSLGRRADLFPALLHGTRSGPFSDQYLHPSNCRQSARALRTMPGDGTRPDCGCCSRPDRSLDRLV